MGVSHSRQDAANLLTAAPDGITLAIACALGSARDLLSLRLTCRRFNVLCSVPSGAWGPAAAVEMLPIVDKAARRWLDGCSEQERGWCSGWCSGESWLRLMHEVELLRLPLVFGRSHAAFTMSEGWAVATKDVGDGSWRGAASKAVMRSGRHFASFTVVRGGAVMYGLVRPDWDVEAEAQGGEHADGHCFYRTYNGERLPSDSDWVGMEGADEGDRIGLLLNLDQGSMTVWKNGVKLGVMRAEGLSGEYCWAVLMCHRGYSVRIESAPPPAMSVLASPTVEELACVTALLLAPRKHTRNPD